MKDQQLTESESLSLITSMIKQAKSNYQGGASFYFLLWGWVIMLANLSHYVLAVLIKYEHPYVVWLATIPAGIVSGIHGARLIKNALVLSHIDRMYNKLWMGIGFGIIVSIVYMQELNLNHNAVILLLTTAGVYMSGQLLKFKPLIFGAYALALASLLAFNVSMIDQCLVAAGGIFLGYLVPGYILKSKEK